MNKAGQLVTLCISASLLAGCAAKATSNDEQSLLVSPPTVTEAPHSLSNSVKWHTKSKEYRLITRGIYQQAEFQLPKVALQNEPWVVVMDVDETILDNIGYQVMLEQTGSHYTSDTWAAWVSSKQATLIPGAAKFVQKVYSLGGKVALVTNRERNLDADTWQNLSKYIPVSVENTCLVGRTQADKDAVNHQNMINDKDLRRQQITEGTVSCFSAQTEQSTWKTAHTIVMQIGDNIEDVNGVTQESADLNKLEKRLNKSVFILPNATYGSW